MDDQLKAQIRRSISAILEGNIQGFELYENPSKGKLYWINKGNLINELSHMFEKVMDEQPTGDRMGCLQ